MRLAVLCLAGSGVLLGGCGGAADAPHRMLVTDSAGVRLVQLMDAGFDRGGVAWSVAARPDVAIGRVSGTEEYLFDQIMGVERLSDGRWAVADMGSSQVRFFDARGRHLQSSGRRGEGPEEFRQVMGLHRLAGDTLAVDDSYVRLQLLDPGGGFIGAIPFAGSIGAERSRPIGAFADGTLLIMTTPAYPQRLAAPRSLATSYARGRLTRDGGRPIIAPMAPIGSWDVLRVVPGWRGGAQRILFDGTTEIGQLREGLVVADPMAFELRYFGTDGQLRTVVRLDWMPRSITPEDIQRARVAFIDMGGEGGREVPERMRQQRAEIADGWVPSSHMPAFSTLLVDSDDHVWLREYVPHEALVGAWEHTRAPVDPSRWVVLAPDGAFVARVRLPARFRPTVIGRDYVAGIFRDEMEVEYVHSYRLTRR